ncbi:hypothetical protein RRG08_059870 [Elysia crispata]|uniref:Uncharacterized protein n=1 Tax=Elysia crispata TaxID=231223 RepID=A0AAE1B2F2_9GAST|nr:hypothetical protein RRG08_059870 [Elysia crispata]
MLDKLHIEHEATRAPKVAAADMSYKLDIEQAATRAQQAAGSRYSTRPPEHHKWRATDMPDKLHIEHAATRAPRVAGNRYARQASHRARGHQSTTSAGQQICQTSFT